MKNKTLLYKTIIRPLLTYACPIWGTTCNSNLLKITRLQNTLLRTITKAPWYVSNSCLREDLKVEPMEHYIQKVAKNFYNAIENHKNPLISIQTIHFEPDHSKKFPFSTTRITERFHPP